MRIKDIKGTAIALAALLPAVLMQAPAVHVIADTAYTPAAGTSCTFKKYLIMDESDPVPDVTFSFSARAGEARAANPLDPTVMRVQAGIGTPTVGDVTFTSSDTTAAAVGTSVDVARTNEDRGGRPGDTVQLDAGEKYAVKQTTVDFTQITFPKPGIYRYIIEETPNQENAQAGIVQDTDSDRVLDVYVTDRGNDTLAVSAYVLHTDDGDVHNQTQDAGGAAGTALTDKTDGFTNEYTSKDLRIRKEVSGNQASRDKYFELTVTVIGVADTDSYTVSLADDGDVTTNDGNADPVSRSNAATIAGNQGKTNPQTVTGSQLKAGQKFYLQHGQSIVIRGFDPDVQYTVTENAEDYQSAVINGGTNAGRIGTIAGESKLAEAGFTNTRAGLIPTGLFMTAAPFAVLMLLSGAGIVFLILKNRRKSAEDQND